MTDVFISYSRRDKVFTQKLVDALQAANREVWADWDSIPAASDWDAEIKEGIENTNTVLFVLSPEWIKSNECRKEMDHAVKMGKRMVPILHIMPAEGQEVPLELAKINWVYMRETDDFDKAFETLQSAMDTDLDWIKTHTRIQVRAVEWEKKNRSASFALRGEDLTEGEQFIASGAEKSPAPTHLQSEYIIASRKDATRKQRQTLAGVTVALIVSIVLSVVAYFQKQEAVKQASISRAGELAAQAEPLIASNFQNALLLGIEAFQESDTLRSRSILLKLATKSPQLQQFLSGKNGLEWANDVAISPNGETIASSGCIESYNYNCKYWGLVLWDGSTGKLITQLLANQTDPIGSFAFNSNGNILASGARRNDVIILWDIQTHQQITQLSTGQAEGTSSITFSHDGTILASGSGDGTIRLWDVETQQPISQSLSGHTYEVSSLAFSPNDEILVSSGGEGIIILWDMKTQKPLGQPFTGQEGGITSVAFSPDGRIFASGGCGKLGSASCIQGEVMLWNVQTRQLIGQPFTGFADTVFSMAFSSDGKVLAVGGGWRDRTIVILHTETSQPISEPIIEPLIGHTSGIKSMLFKPNSNILMSSAFDNIIILWDITKQKTIGQALTGIPYSISNFALSPDGKTLLVTNDNKSPILWDINTYQQVGQPMAGYSKIFSPDGKTVVSVEESNNIVLWDVETQQPIDQPILGSEPLAFSPDSKTLGVTSVDNSIILWDLETNQPVGRPLRAKTGVYSIAFSPNGKLLATGGTEVMLWNLATNNPEGKPLTGHNASINEVAFSPSGKTLATAGNDGTVILWNVETHQAIDQLITSGNYVYTIAFSSNGNILASGDETGHIILWDVETHQPIGQPLTAHHIGVTELAFVPESNTLISGSWFDSTIVLWDLDPLTWMAQSCQRVGRNFTRAEWAKYFPNEDYRKTCEQWDLETELPPSPIATQ